jgi:nucleotide-binding universal stress UspA family protein
MDIRLFHIFRNTPLGRETILQSLYFCQTMGASPVVYVPQHTKFLMYFENDVVQVDLDSSYLTAPSSANQHLIELFDQHGMNPRFLKPKHFTASTLPDIPTNFDFMCCPRSISDLSSKIGLGYIGPRVRRIVKSAPFPVLIASPVFKKWDKIAVLFGGSTNAINALKLGFRLQRATALPLDIFTQIEREGEDLYRQKIRDEQLEDELERHANKWHFFSDGHFEENLYDIPHDALVVLGAYGHGFIKDIFFGSKMEKIQSTISNNLLIVGPNYTSAR